MNATDRQTNDSDMLSRAQGCLLGQLAGDALGSLVEFQTSEQITAKYPDRVRDLADGGTWGTIAGQPTDDSEMALMLARSIVKEGRFDAAKVRDAYVYWLDSGPFDCGNTVRCGLRGYPIYDSQANGAMMRVSPLAIFGANHPLESVSEWAQSDAGLTHPHIVCLQANSIFAMAIANAIQTGCGPYELYRRMCTWADERDIEPALLRVMEAASDKPPFDFKTNQGWVLIAFQNALWQLLHAPNLEEGVVDTVMHGGDTDTNAAICGALLGSVYGRDSVPERWTEAILNCRPESGNPRVKQPRPKVFWPVDALELAEQLLSV